MAVVSTIVRKYAMRLCPQLNQKAQKNTGRKKTANRVLFAERYPTNGPDLAGAAVYVHGRAVHSTSLDYQVTEITNTVLNFDFVSGVSLKTETIPPSALLTPEGELGVAQERPPWGALYTREALKGDSMKYIVYGYKNFIYAIPAWDEKELWAAAELEKDYGGQFRIVGEFTGTADVPAGRKWYGVQQNKGDKTPLLALLKGVERNADYM